MHQSPSRSRVRVPSQTEDDIDRLFNHLDQLEPPDELIAHILDHVEHLPPPSAVSHPVEHEQGGHLLVYNEWRDPS